MTETTPKIIAYLSPMCPWTRGVVHFLQSHNFEFETRDVSRDADAYRDMVTRSGQHSSPCVEIDGHMLADVGGDEVEVWMRQNGHI